MAEKQIQQILTQLRSAHLAYPDAAKLLSKAKLLLLQLGALTPTMSTSSSSPSAATKQPASQLALARETHKRSSPPKIRSEIASSSERAYPSLPISSTKSLLFLDSEGAVVDFATSRGWSVRDGHIYFPATAADAAATGQSEKPISQMFIENTLGYARELETIV
ncbi:26S proteasome non-ATPase regulatory subunit 8 [Magnaporthiopsis poae ATCC 64411]|uniref:26S proteasome non-ATPase regulatory subunit 8 n=1 Tax=Magnaporthiopsis poae (strain ATCC 64411 / 73-15) TaxID=644358 RepID=A0A0C4EFH6_MAGP6|nr:26S proteasome non-ATPase regulatory subunit 8 [Magnaporthiopsis poae ATCC 64411]